MSEGDINKLHAVNYFRAVVQQEFVKVAQLHHHDPEVYAILKQLKNRLDIKLGYGGDFFRLGLDKTTKLRRAS